MDDYEIHRARAVELRTEAERYRIARKAADARKAQPAQGPRPRAAAAERRVKAA